MSKQYLATRKIAVTVSDSDTDYSNLIGKLFNLVRRQIYEELKLPIIQMETDEFYIEDMSKHIETEHFFFIFWPREKITYTITARVMVTVKYIDLSKEEIT